MILVRHLNGVLYFLVREPEESRALESLEATYPGRPIEVVEKRGGLQIVRVGPVDGELGATAAEGQPDPPEFAIVGLDLSLRRSGLRS